MKTITIVAAIVLLSICATAAMAWADNFDSYAPGPLTMANSPYNGGYLDGDPSQALVDPTNMNVVADTGYGGTQGVAVPLEVRSRAYRPADTGDDILTFRFYTQQAVTTGYTREMNVKMTTDNAYESAYGSSVTGPALGINLAWTASWSVRFLYLGAAGWEWDPSTAHRYLNTNTWYDMEIKLLSPTQVQYSYKESSASAWAAQLVQTVPDGFAFNWVNLETVGYYQPDNPPTMIDNLRTKSSLTLSIFGTISLSDYSGDGTNLPVTVQVQIRNAGTGELAVPVQTVDVTPANGAYEVPNVPAGTYNVLFKAASWLRKTVANVSPGDTPVNVTLTNGDIDGDNEITTTDLSVLLPNLN